MAIAFSQSLGTGLGTSAATTTTISFSGGTKPAVGDSVLVACSRDNIVTDPVTGDTMTDSNGNFYFRVNAKAGSTTTAAGGIVGVLFQSIISTAWSAGTNTITWTHPSVTARALRADHFTGMGGFRLGSSANGSTTVGASISVTTGATAPVSGDLVYGMTAAEYGSNAAPTTVDTDTTNGSWSTTAFIGNGTSSVSGAKVATQYKIVTAGGAQTFGPIGGFGATTNVDVVGIVASFMPAQSAISTLTDNFSTYNTGVWTTSQGTAPTSVSGQLRFVTENTYVEVVSNTHYSLINSSLYIEVFPENTASTSREFQVALRLAGSNNEKLEIYHSDNDVTTFLGFQRYTGGTATTTYVQPYDTTAHHWWRFRESAGTINLDTSPDASTWTSQVSFDLNTLGWQPTDMEVFLTSGHFNVTEVEPAYQYLDNLNLQPAASANLGTATLALSGNNLTDLGQFNQTAGSLGVTANNFSSTRNLGTASLALIANNLGRLGQYNLGTASLALTANNLGRLGQYNLGSATLGLSAYGLTVGANPASANLGAAALGLSAFSISGSRNLNSAALAFVANAIAQTRTFSKADVGFVATSLDTISLGAEPIGQGRTIPSAALGLSAYNFTYGGQVLPGASVALAATLLGSSRAMSAATLGVTAYGLTVAAVLSTANLGTATVGFTANPLTLNDTILAIAASLGISANALGFTDSLSVGTASLALSANNLADSETTTAASLGVTATGLASSRALSATTVSFSASGITTAGYALASASIAVIANNLSLFGSFNLGTATFSLTAFNMTNQTTGQATLGRGDLSVNAQGLSVSLSTGLTASLAMSATNLARAAVVGTSSLSVAALGMTQLRSAALGLASLVTTAYNMSQSAPGSAALGSGTLLLSANPMTRFALLSAGLATMALDANAIQPKANTSGAVGSMSTAAQPMSSTRAVAKGILDLTAYGFGTYRPSTLGTAALTITAYTLSAQTGKSKGRISVRNGYVQFKSGGRVLAGPKVANPISSFKTVGG